MKEEIAEKKKKKEADYILQVRGNQQSFMEDIALYFEKEVFPCGKSELGKEDRYYKEICFDHGRQEIREYYTEEIYLQSLRLPCVLWVGKLS